MNRPSSRCRLALIVVAAWLGGAGCSAVAPDGGATAKTGTTGAAPQGMRVYRDPVTGAFTAPPASSGGLAAPSAAVVAARRALVEVPAPGSGTGMMVQLNGSFRSDVTAKVDPAGTTVTCTSSSGPH